MFGSFRRSPITATYCTLSAVLTLLNARNNKWDGVVDASNNKNIEVGLKVLEELSVSWSPARRFRQSLQKLYRPSRNDLAVASGSTTDAASDAPAESSNQSSNGTFEALLADMQALRNRTASSDADSSTEAATWSTSLSEGLDAPSIDHFDEWLFNEMTRDPTLSGADFMVDLDNFSYVETNPIFQSDSLPPDYSSFDFLNRTNMHHM